MERFASSAKVARRVLARLESASPEQIHEGQYWYASARQTVDSMALLGNLTTDSVAGIVAALSPQTRWEQNIAGALRVVAARRARKRLPKGVSLYPTNSRKAWRIANGADPISVLSGKKVVPFYRNLAGDEQHVTVDTWIWKGAGLSGTLTDSRNRAIQRAYKLVAKRTGFTPAQAQAIDWIIVRGKGA